MPLIGKSAHGIKQFECSVDLLSPPHLLGNMYIVLCPKLYYQFQYIQGPPDDKRVHNSHVLVDDHGSIAAVYRKIHLFDIDVKDGPQLKESDGTIPGDQIVPPVPTPVGNVGLAIVSLMGHGGIKLTLTKRKMGFVPYNLTTSIRPYHNSCDNLNDFIAKTIQLPPCYAQWTMCDKKGNAPVEKIFSSTVDASLSLLKLLSVGLALPLGAGVLPIMAYMGRLRPKGVPFSGSRYMKG